MKLLSLFTRHGESAYPGAFERLIEFYRNIGNLDYEVLLLDTTLPVGFCTNLSSNARLFGGDNSRREFSAWNTALEYLEDVLENYDLVNIVTSAFENEYRGFYSCINAEMLSYAASHPKLVLGHIDAIPKPVGFFEDFFQTWACSKFILFSPKVLKDLGSLSGPFEESDFFQDSVKNPFKNNGFLSEGFRKILYSWLVKSEFMPRQNYGPSTKVQDLITLRGQTLRTIQWHSAFELNESTLSKFLFVAENWGFHLVVFLWLSNRSFKDP